MKATRFDRTRLVGAFWRLFCAALFLPAAAHAQYGVEVKLNKATYATYEGVEATLDINNRSGSDIVLGGPSDSQWLAFDITDPAGNQVPPLRVRSQESIVFKSGTTLSKKIVLSDYYSFSDYGNYTVVASVYHPASQQYYASNRAHAAFTEPSTLGKPISFGVPAGLPGAGKIRNYSLALMRDLERTYLYVRLLEDKTNLKLATFSLGTVIMINDPQVTMDKENRLHILFMAAPHIYSHVIVDTQGRIAKREYFQEIQTDRPQLTVAANDTIAVRGGSPYDPAAKPPEKLKGRSIGQKPPGL
jgi:hypothetical protein